MHHYGVCVCAVSYTHLDVYKRQPLSRAIKKADTYLADDILSLKEETGNINCQLEWWDKHQHMYPNLSKIFKSKYKIISVSVPCERRFSKSGQLISDRRSSFKKSRDANFFKC